jgi:uncharacterized metal-binding protein YceD (DUF177 family)
MALKPVTPEFSRPINVSRLPKSGSHEVIAASADECQRLAKRLGLEALHGLTARLHAKPWRGGGVKVIGEMQADLEQLSVVSLEPFRHVQRIEVERYFMEVPLEDDDPEAELIDPIERGHIDLGEMLAETLAVELDPYPRKPGEEFAKTDK